ncbi:hypothetical protein GCM10009006_37530 [Haloarcula argentinensis]|uniref:Uncharacterized protein n=1 Tax=Haloarcula argentinensis TaxID=43776 RepID=A0A830FS57_HALAR|nr:hypothetical protein GCM10009006_37530 [Haloarcula argentinensis]
MSLLIGRPDGDSRLCNPQSRLVCDRASRREDPLKQLNLAANLEMLRRIKR